MTSKAWLLSALIMMIGLTKVGAEMPDESRPVQPAEAGGYIIIEHEAVSPEKLVRLKTYSKVTRGLIAKYGGTFLVVEGQQIDSLEVKWSPEFVVILEFLSLTAARLFYNSEDYQTVLPDRLSAFQASRAILVSGRVFPAPR